MCDSVPIPGYDLAKLFDGVDAVGTPILFPREQCNVTSGSCDIDIDECSWDHGGCDLHVNCTNFFGSYECGPCPIGWSGSGYTQCVRECDQVYLGEGIGWVNVFEWYDSDDSCHLNVEELDTICSSDDYYDQCLQFLGAEQQCEPLYLGEEVGYVNVFDWVDEDSTCELNEDELAAVCQQYRDACCDFISSIPGTCEDTVAPAPEPEVPTVCDPMFLGDDIGWANVFIYHDEDASCKLDMAELVSLCESFYEQCLAFLYGQTMQPQLEDKCEPIYLGEETGWTDVVRYFDVGGQHGGSEGDCAIDADELTAICAEVEEECRAFIGTNECEPIYLGEDMGWMQVFEHYDDGDCQMDIDELTVMCAEEEVTDFCRQMLHNETECSPVFLGNDVGWASVFHYYDDGDCKVDADELAAICDDYEDECRAYAGGNSTCEPVFLGEEIGWADVFTYDEVDGKCDLDLPLLSATCATKYKECLAYLHAGQCAPVNLGEELGWANVFEWTAVDENCHLDVAELAAVCGESYPQCLITLNVTAEHPGCAPVFLGPHVGFVSVFDRADGDDSCHLNVDEFVAVCAVHYEECVQFLQSADDTHTQWQHRDTEHKCAQVFLGPHVRSVNVFHWSDTDKSCKLDSDELLNICGDNYDECMAFVHSDEIGEMCDPVYLGETVGWANIFVFEERSGTCKVDSSRLAAACGGEQRACEETLASGQTHECEPIYLGEDVGFVHVFHYADEDGTCHLDSAELASVCENYEDECRAFISGTG
jgi:hypothetical protein